MRTQSEKAQAFRDMHARRDAFIIPNPWDPGSAVLLAAAGFEALATTSAGYAFSAGRRDNDVGREAMMTHIAAIAAATDLPVSADLENGLGAAPGDVAECIRLAGQTGVVGGSIEDSTGDPHRPLYDLGFAVERMQAAAEAARRLPFAFTLTGRAENFIVGRPDLKDTITRLQAYQDAGADVLYAPGLPTEEDIAAVVSAVDRPINILAGSQGLSVTRAKLATLGVGRISVGGALARLAYGSLLQAAAEMQNAGAFTFTKDAVAHGALNAMFPTQAVSSTRQS